MARYVPLGNITRPRQISNDEKEPIGWFTSNGARIPIYEGQTKQQAFVAYVEKRNAEIREKLKRDEQEEALKNQQMQKAKEEADRLNDKIEKPVLSGNYKAITPQMRDIAIQTAEEMQRDFPLLHKSFEVKYEKYMDAMGYGFTDRIELNGAMIKKRLASGHLTEKELRSVVAHELTHVMQNRWWQRIGKKGDDYNAFIDNIWNSTVNRYIESNPKFSLAEINKMTSNQYGGGGHSRYGGDSVERMAVAVEMAYKGNNDAVADIGKLLIDEMKKWR